MLKQVNKYKMSNKKVNIDKIFCNESEQLIIKHGNAYATILDEEIDELKCTFNNDMCVTIDTSEMSYIVLSLKNLGVLQDLILDADDFYNKKFKKKLSSKI